MAVEQMTDGTIISDVISGKDAKLFASSVALLYDHDSYRDSLLNADDDSFLLITKKIGSIITITDVKIVDDDLINAMIS